MAGSISRLATRHGLTDGFPATQARRRLLLRLSPWIAAARRPRPVLPVPVPVESRHGARSASAAASAPDGSPPPSTHTGPWNWAAVWTRGRLDHIAVPS